MFPSDRPAVIAIEPHPLAELAAKAINDDLFYSRSLTPKEQVVLIYHLIDRWNAVHKVGHLLAVTIPKPSNLKDYQVKNLINLTPHAVVVYGQQGITEIPASGQLCRVRNSQEPVGSLAGIPVYRQSFEAVEGLPEPQVGHVYIVSSLVLRALAEGGMSRGDVVAPGTGPQDGCVRDTSGRILGVTRFVKA